MAEKRPGRMKPKYLEIADDLRTKIESGKLSGDTQLPTKAALMDQYSVALNTVDRAIEVLRVSGLVETFQGVGTFVRVPLEQPESNDAADAKRMDDLERRLARLEAQVMDICANMGKTYHPDVTETRAAETR